MPGPFFLSEEFKMTDLREIEQLKRPYTKPTDTRVAAVNAWQLLQIAAGACRELDPAAEDIALEIQTAAGQRIVRLFEHDGVKLATVDVHFQNSDPFENWDRGPTVNVKPFDP